VKAFELPESDTPIKRHRNVAVVGGGNVAMDSVRTALRLGADNAYIVYRRGMEELPARGEEVEHAQHEGVQFKILTAPVRVIGNKEGWVEGLECLEMELGEPDASGRRRPVVEPDSEFTLEVELVVEAMGETADPAMATLLPGVDLTDGGLVRVEPETLATSRPGVWAAGDLVNGGETVVRAVAEGRLAAERIDAHLAGPLVAGTD
jgi:glutamate synthase (NADPH/NADH) small chain